MTETKATTFKLKDARTAAKELIELLATGIPVAIFNWGMALFVSLPDLGEGNCPDETTAATWGGTTAPRRRGRRCLRLPH